MPITNNVNLADLIVLFLLEFLNPGNRSYKLVVGVGLEPNSETLH